MKKVKFKYLLDILAILIVLVCSHDSNAEKPTHKIGLFFFQYGWLITLGIFAIAIFLLFRAIVYNMKIPSICTNLAFVFGLLLILQVASNIYVGEYSGEPDELIKDGTFILLYVLAAHYHLNKEKKTSE